ncbi:MAG: tetratricopeptide repeat protein, partial [Thermoanaerobaculia bacterium]|nr:tetratricopeptide repeat protein [Thermoanaerobaculia bacterium]
MTIRRQKTVQAAEKLVQKGRLEAAIGEYRKVLNDAPNDTRTLNRVGDLYLRLGRLDEAVDLFGRAASHFSREGFYVKAIAIYKKVIRVDPTRIEIYEALADLYRQQGLLNEARAQYQVVADYHAQSGDTLAVISIQRKIVELDPQDPAARLALADLCLQADRRPEAVAQYLEIAELMVEHERYGEAVRFYGRALDLDPSDLSFLTDAVLELKDRGQAVVAEELLAKAEEVNPEASRVRRMTGLKDASEAAAPAEVPAPEPEAQTPPPAAPPSEVESAVPVVDRTAEAPPAAAAEEPA